MYHTALLKARHVWDVWLDVKLAQLLHLLKYVKLYLILLYFCFLILHLIVLFYDEYDRANPMISYDITERFLIWRLQKSDLKI